MKLKELLLSISRKIDEFRRMIITKASIRRVSLVIGSLLVLLILFLIIRNTNESKTVESEIDQTSKSAKLQSEGDADEKIKQLLDSYDSCLKSYNEAAKNYNMLITGLEDRGFTNEEKSVDQKENKLLALDKQTEEDIELAIEQISNDTKNLLYSYGAKCSECYNMVISDQNSYIQKYNTAVDRIGNYANILGVEQKKEIDEVKENQQWDDPLYYFKELDSVMKNKTEAADDYTKLLKDSLAEIIKDYNTIADEYNSLVDKSIIDYVDGIPKKAITQKEFDEAFIAEKTEEDLIELIDNNIKKKDEIVENYLVVSQITNPSEEWVEQKLSKINYITKYEGVTKEIDPNGLLDKDGGYTSCIYFMAAGINPKDVPGESIVEKGTDVGGAIEIYDSREHALNRCDYLSQFDGTLLYSGSYTAVGTMVVRTSYKFDDDQQIRLTNSIITEFTKIE